MVIGGGVIKGLDQSHTSALPEQAHRSILRRMSKKPAKEKGAAKRGETGPVTTRKPSALLENEGGTNVT